MPTTSVTRGFQVTIPQEIRSKAGVKIGDSLIVEYDDTSETIKIRVPSRRRKTLKLERKITIDEIEQAIMQGSE
jgi:antitoxin PrlF